DWFAEMRFGPVLQFAQNERGNFGRRERLVSEFHANHVLARRIDAERKKLQFVLNVGDAPAHQTLHGVDAAIRLRQQSSPGRLANDDPAVGVDAHYRWAQRASVRSNDALRRVRLRIDVRNEAVCSSEIDSYDSSHVLG